MVSEKLTSLDREIHTCVNCWENPVLLTCDNQAPKRNASLEKTKAHAYILHPSQFTLHLKAFGFGSDSHLLDCCSGGQSQFGVEGQFGVVGKNGGV